MAASKKRKGMTLKIGHRMIPVVAMHPTHAAGHEQRGCFIPIHGRIEIDATESPRNQAEITVHEVLHALWDAASLDGKEKEEKVVVALSKQIVTLIWNNPEFFDHLREAMVNEKPLPIGEK